MTEALERVQTTKLAVETNIFTDYLESFGLPTTNIIATTDEREVVATNLPSFLETLSPEEKRDARYLSKFVGATAIGLFDAALNYVWNEVVLNLRKKAVVYGVDLFFDAAVGGKNRDMYQDEGDLSGIKDTVLLETCRKLELLSDVVYRKLDHVLTMRNEVAASHPNVESIGGYELLGWLQTCVKDILQDQPSESAIRIKAMVGNLRSREDLLDESMRRRFVEELKNLSLPHVNNLTVTFFGIYIAEDTSQMLRKNISLIAKDVWDLAGDRVRYSTGIKVDGYKTNLRQPEFDRGSEFFRLVDGHRYETPSAKLISLDTLTEHLLSAHQALNNFYNEPPIMQEIMFYCREPADIPSEIIPKLVKTVIRCRIGRGVSYHEGVSPAARPMYDKFLSLLDDKGVPYALHALFEPEVSSKLTISICQEHLKSILSMLKISALSERLVAAIEFLEEDIEAAHHANLKKEFREICAPFFRL